MNKRNFLRPFILTSAALLATPAAASLPANVSVESGPTALATPSATPFVIDHAQPTLAQFGQHASHSSHSSHASHASHSSHASSSF